MLTNERHEIILTLLAEKQTVKIIDLMEATAASESTIRRDLTELENIHKLERIHGGATVSERNIQELSILDKSTRNLQEKIRLARFASTLVQDEDFIYLDAGTTTFQMIPFLKNKKIDIEMRKQSKNLQIKFKYLFICRLNLKQLSCDSKSKLE